jgi:hypothetical protein
MVKSRIAEEDHMHETAERVKRAREILDACGIEVMTDFRSLDPLQVAALQAYADQHRLKKYGPTSVLRRLPNDDKLLQSFHDLLRRRAAARIASSRSKAKPSPKGKQ